MAQQLTIKQIAALAGVSVGTVDRVLHNRGRVSPEAMSAVQAVLDTQNYKYNIHSSAIAFKKTKKSFTIIIAIPFSKKGEYWDLVKTGIDSAFAEYSDISISSRYAFFDQFNSLSCREVFGSIADQDCSAVIIGTTFVDETRELCHKLNIKGIPYAFVDGKVSDTNPVATYHADQKACGKLLARLMDGLTPAGRKLALMLPKRTGTQMSNNSTIRLEHFRAYFQETRKEREILESHFSTEDPALTRKEMAELLDGNPGIGGIAVVISNAYLIAEALPAGGKKDIRIGGFDITAGNARCVREGRIDFLINQHPERQGFLAVESTLHFLLYGIPDKSLGELIPIDIKFLENL